MQAAHVIELRPFAHRIRQMHAPPARQQEEMLEPVLNEEIDDVVGKCQGK
jgi:hypothetical protein